MHFSCLIVLLYAITRISSKKEKGTFISFSATLTYYAPVNPVIRNIQQLRNLFFTIPTIKMNIGCPLKEFSVGISTNQNLSFWISSDAQFNNPGAKHYSTADSSTCSFSNLTWGETSYDSYQLKGDMINEEIEKDGKYIIHSFLWVKNIIPEDDAKFFTNVNGLWALCKENWNSTSINNPIISFLQSLLKGKMIKDNIFSFDFRNIRNGSVIFGKSYPSIKYCESNDNSLKSSWYCELKNGVNLFNQTIDLHNKMYIDSSLPYFLLSNDLGTAIFDIIIQENKQCSKYSVSDITFLTCIGDITELWKEDLTFCFDHQVNVRISMNTMSNLLYEQNQKVFVFKMFIDNTKNQNIWGSDLLKRRVVSFDQDNLRIGFSDLNEYWEEEYESFNWLYIKRNLLECNIVVCFLGMVLELFLRWFKKNK